MINFNIDDTTFNYRVGSIIIDEENKRILLNRDLDKNYWFLPGGRCEAFEFAKEALAREAKEEMDSEIIIDRPVFFIENLFHLKDKKVHEIGIYYLAHFSEGNPILEKEEFPFDENNRNFLFKWFPLSEIKDLNIQPAILKERLLNLPAEVEFIENKE